MEDSMGMLLAVLVLAALSVGFISLMALPLLYIWLAVSVYREPWKEEAPLITEPAAPEPEVEPKPAEKPRVMVAGRRRPV
jgi:hypothetical protein